MNVKNGRSLDGSGDPRDIVIRLADIDEQRYGVVGGKAANLARLLDAGYRVPTGFCISIDAYHLVVESALITRKIELELGRKPLDKMRWEEMWDTALRIRSWFLNCTIPGSVAFAIEQAYRNMFSDGPLVVRSSAIGEDSSALSFAGLHESVVDVRGLDALMRAIRVVWASLWSDAALLYRREMSLDPRSSAMAVVVQEFIPGGPSGVAFGRDPRSPRSEYAMFEAVPDQNSELVDGLVDPDRWLIDRNSGKTKEWFPGKRDEDRRSAPLLNDEDLQSLLKLVQEIESLFGWAADVEWTGHKATLTVLQARPISSLETDKDDDERRWYLSLRPNAKRLRKLARRVSEELIPRLDREGQLLAGENLEALSDKDLSASVRNRFESLRRWQNIYVDDFIPFAHGVRQLGIFYNNAVNPRDPYEFMGLLQQKDMLASRRNRHLAAMAEMVRLDSALMTFLDEYDAAIHSGDKKTWSSFADRMRRDGVGLAFLEELRDLLQSEADIAYKGERLTQHPELFIHAILELASVDDTMRANGGIVDSGYESVEDLERKLFDAVGERGTAEAREALELGRLSWRLRDDDNVLMGRLESQLIRALEIASGRLRQRGLLSGGAPLNDRISLILADALIHPPDEAIDLAEYGEREAVAGTEKDIKARQLIGQPAGRGVATGSARIVANTGDLLQFKAGDVLVCDAIQPTMTHIVPLACAIVERRGGMLIHGAIIARELGIPCVNGVADATRLIQNGEPVTVDGYLGIVTIGPPELLMETAGSIAPTIEPA